MGVVVVVVVVVPVSGPVLVQNWITN